MRHRQAAIVLVIALAAGCREKSTQELAKDAQEANGEVVEKQKEAEKAQERLDKARDAARKEDRELERARKQAQEKREELSRRARADSAARPSPQLPPAARTP